MEIKIRNIKKEDFYEVECLTKRAFWNLYMPGCDEHYLVHRLVKDENFINELSSVAILNGKIVGVILYAKGKIESGNKDTESLLFGPLCVEPLYQKNKIGEALLNSSIAKAKQLGYKSIFIYGDPEYYKKFGFISADKFGVTTSLGTNFDAFMGLELIKGTLNQINGRFIEPLVYDSDLKDESYLKALEEFDKNYPYLEKKVLKGQWR